MMKSLVIFFGCILGLGVANAATTNVTYEPRLAMSANARARTRQLVADMKNRTARGHIRELMASLTSPIIENYAKMLSGESPLSFQNSRYTLGVGPLHPFGIEHAIKFVEEEMLKYGFTVQQVQYLDGYAPNIVSCLPGTVTPDQIVVMGAHLDNIPSTGRAPGANDDGSGSASLMAAAAAIHTLGATFGKTLCFEHYTGEEQGLRGSRAMAELRAKRGDDVVAMLQQDMIAVQLPGDQTGLAFVDDTRATDPDLTDAVEMILRNYVDPNLMLHPRVLSGSSCCSDHQSYTENGFPSVGFIEPRGYTGDPMYHTSGDLVERDEYSITQLTLAAQAALAAGAELADMNFGTD